MIKGKLFLKGSTVAPGRWVLKVLCRSSDTVDDINPALPNSKDDYFYHMTTTRKDYYDVGKVYPITVPRTLWVLHHLDTSGNRQSRALRGTAYTGLGFRVPIKSRYGWFPKSGPLC